MANLMLSLMLSTPKTTDTGFDHIACKITWMLACVCALHALVHCCSLLMLLPTVCYHVPVHDARTWLFFRHGFLGLQLVGSGQSEAAAMPRLPIRMQPQLKGVAAGGQRVVGGA